MRPYTAKPCYMTTGLGRLPFTSEPGITSIYLSQVDFGVEPSTQLLDDARVPQRPGRFPKENVEQLREAAKKNLFFSGPTTKSLVVIRNFFLHGHKFKKYVFKKFLFP